MATFLPQPTNAFGVQGADFSSPLYQPPVPQVAAAPTAFAPPTRVAPQPSPYAGPLAAGMAGLQAGQLGSQATDFKTGAVSVLGGAAAGALAGSAGGPVGAAVGGVVGGGLAALNSWLSVGKENKANRDRRQLLAEAKAEQNRRDKIARDDALDGLAYERRQVDEAKRLEEWQRARGLIADARAKSKARKEEYLNQGFVA